MMMKFVIFAAALAASSAASAAEISLGRNGSANVFVWKDSAAYKEAVQLITAGVHNTKPELVFRLMSCIVNKGTKAVVTDGGMFSSTVLITDGPKVGCRGLVTVEDMN